MLVVMMVGWCVILVADDQKYLEKAVYPSLVPSLQRLLEAAVTSGVIEGAVETGVSRSSGVPSSVPGRGPLSAPDGLVFDPLKFLAEDLMRSTGAPSGA